MAGKSAGFAISVGIQDDASKGLDAINKRIAAMSAPAERFNKSLAKFGEVTGINRAAEGMQALGDRALGAARAIERMAAPMAGITGAASLAGIAEMSRRWADAGNQISKTAYLLSMPVAKLSALRGAAELAGSSADAMDSSLTGLDKTLNDAHWGKASAPVVALLNQFKIAFHGAGGLARKSGDAIGEVLRAALTYKDPDAQKHFLEMLGVSPDLLPLARAGLEKELQRMQRTGAVMTEDMAEHAKTMKSSWTELGLAIEGVGNKLIDNMSGPITKWLDKASHWIETDKDLSDNIGKIGTAIGAIGAIELGGWALRMIAGLNPLTLALAGIAETIYKIETFTEKGGGGDPASYPVGSPFWRGIPDEEQGNYVNSPRSQAFLHPNGENPNPFQWWNPGSWWRGGGAGSDTVPSRGPAGAARGIRNFNPLNLGYLPNQPSVLGREEGGDHRFGVFSSMAAGIAAELRQLALYQGSGLKTVHDLVKRWVSDPMFDQSSYERDVARSIGVGVNDPINIRDPATAAAYFRAAAPHESGPVSDTDIASGVRMGLGYRDVAGAAGPTGHVQVDVTLRGAPPGTTAQVTASGATSATPPRIETSMPMAR
jgi:hypothetical protein